MYEARYLSVFARWLNTFHVQTFAMASGFLFSAYVQYKNVLTIMRIFAVGYNVEQLVTISRPTAYGEYISYHFVDAEQEFQTQVKRLHS